MFIIYCLLLEPRQLIPGNRAQPVVVERCRCSANIFPPQKSFHLTSLRLREAIFTPPSRWLRLQCNLLRKNFRLRCLTCVRVSLTRFADMPFYDKLSVYVDNGAYRRIQVLITVCRYQVLHERFVCYNFWRELSIIRARLWLASMMTLCYGYNK